AARPPRHRSSRGLKRLRSAHRFGHQLRTAITCSALGCCSRASVARPTHAVIGASCACPTTFGRTDVVGRAKLAPSHAIIGQAALALLHSIRIVLRLRLPYYIQFGLYSGCACPTTLNSD